MLASMLFRSFRGDNSRKKKSQIHAKTEEPNRQNFSTGILFNGDSAPKKPGLSFRSDSHHDICAKAKKTSSKVSSFTNLIQRVTGSCLTQPQPVYDSEDDKYRTDEGENRETDIEMEILIGEVFEAISAMRRAYASMQEAHCPWDEDKMMCADMAVVAELRRLGELRERFGRRKGMAARLRKAAVEDLKRLVKAEEAGVEKLRAELWAAVKGRSDHSWRKVNRHYASVAPAPELFKATMTMAATPTPELFEATMAMVIDASKSFTKQLLSLMHAANWDMGAVVRSIESATNAAIPIQTDAAVIGANHAKYALESHVSRKIFQGFHHETFYISDNLSYFLHPDQLRYQFFAQYQEMEAIDPIELLQVLPTTSHFSKFCSNKYLAIVHPKMEESLFGDLEQRRQVVVGNHPRSPFYGEFVGLAKAVWMLHLLAFSLDLPPSHFEATRGAKYNPQYMESVIRFLSGRGGAGQVVGYPVTPGFKLGNGSIIKARVYVLPST
ncbi:protein GRAVITROPIC IN THE LIGHT 1-like [Diospyros lotus]|uniref:protein GRAVITROPIC IN THE LIGHT 1-like n=1 Tax=Diospyros lotus TaxID=55363 RepID=UPI00224DBDA0|nr:protein GRAVITROPIC IN THE LIGHT 1-like [Diospyros lotus]